MAREKGFMVGKDPSIGRSDYAGLPKEIKMEEYPKKRMADGMLDDSMVDIDRLMEKSEGKRSRYVSDQK